MEVDQLASDTAKVSMPRESTLVELNFDSDRLKIFYEHVFPYQLFFKWLSYNQMRSS